MTDGERLLRAVCDEPEDDAPRLVYSDWLEENGHDARAQFIRAQIAAARLPMHEPERMDLEAEAFRLACQHGREWRGELPRLVGGPWERGFAAWCCPVGDQSVEAALACNSGSPVHKFDCSMWSEKLEGTLPEKISWLFLNEPAPSSRVDYDRFLHSPRIQRIRHFALHHGGDHAWNAARAIAATPALGLESLSLDDCGLDLLSVRMLAEAPHLVGLRSLSLDGGLPASAEATLKRTELLGSLRKLSLARSVSGPDALLDILYGVRSGNLEQLRIDECPLGDLGATRLSTASQLRNLRALAISSTGITADGIRSIVGSEHLGSLRRLDAEHILGGKAVAEMLSRSPLADSLTVFRASNPPAATDEEKFADQGLLRLAKFPQMRELSLRGAGITDRGAIALARSQNLGPLRCLDLGDNEIGDAGIVALAESPNLPHLVRLVIDGNRFGDKGAQALLLTPNRRGLCSLEFLSYHSFEGFVPTPLSWAHMERLKARFDRPEALFPPGYCFWR